MTSVVDIDKVQPKKNKMIAVAGSSLAGTAMEWYDFFLYGTASALVFNKVFFPSDDPVIGTMLAMGTFSVGFLARPLGAIVMGYMGDKYGRRTTLITSLLLMGISTTLIALVPSYASIGILAPLILMLLRLIQGFAMGGEWGGAVLLVSEHGNTSSRRAFWASWPNMGPPIGNLLAAAVMAILSQSMSNESFLAWGWRIAFGLSALLVLGGLALRLYVEETPLFKASQKKKDKKAVKPVKFSQLISQHWKSILIATGSRMGENAGFYIYSLFIITYATQFMGMARGTVLTSVMTGQVVAVFSIPAIAVLADKIGRRPIIIAASIATILWGFGFFYFLEQRTTAGVTIAAVVGLFIFAAYSAVIGAFFSELFPTEVRYRGTSISYNLASVLAGGLSPMIALALYTHFGTGYAIGTYLALMGMLSLIAALAAQETRDLKLSDLDAAES